MYEDFLKLLDSQATDKLDKEYWTKIKYILQETEKDKLIMLTSHKITFYFSKETGLLKGISRDKV